MTAPGVTLDVMVDIDDVICPTIDSIHELARQAGLHDGSVDPAWKGWIAYGCAEEDYWDLWSQFALSGGYTNTPPIPGTVEALRELYWAGHRIHLVTARGFMGNAENIRAWTPQWVEEFAVPHETLTFAQDKVAAQAELGVRFDVSIDDSPRNAWALLDDGICSALLTHAHNRAENYPFRVDSVREFVDLIADSSGGWRQRWITGSST